MSVYPNLPGVTDDQRERAVGHLQRCYADRLIGEDELDRRLDLALLARDRVELNRSLVGLARVAPAVLTRPRTGQPAPIENVGAGLAQLSGLFSWFLGPAIIKAVATPGSRLWWEASRSLSLQLTAGVVGVIALVLSVILGTEALLGLMWVAWFGGTIWAAVRAFNGQRGTGAVEPLLLFRAHEPKRSLR